MKDKNKVRILAISAYNAIKDATPKDLEKVVDNFSDYLKKHRQEKFIPDILKELENLRLTEEGIVQAEVISKEPLSELAVKHIEDLLAKRTHKKILLKPVINEEIIGGVSIRYGDQVIDLSLKNHLHNLSKQLSN